MAQIKELFEIFNFHTFVYSFFLLLASFIFIFETIKKVCSIFGIKFKKTIEQEKQAKKIEEIDEIKKHILEIEQQSIKHDKELDTKLNNLTKIVVDDQIDRMRYEILDMASAISESKRWYSVEQLKHALKTYDKYEKILEEYGLENGEVDLSIQIIQQAYKTKYNGMGTI